MYKDSIILLASISLILLSGCSNNTNSAVASVQEDASGGPRVLGISTDRKVGLCDIIPASAVSEVTGIEFKEDRDFLPNQTDVIKACNYHGKNGENINVIVYFSPDTEQAKTSFEIVRNAQKEKDTFKDVEGVGTKAFVFGNKYISQLDAYYKNLWIDISFGVDKEDSLTRVKHVANMVFETF